MKTLLFCTALFCLSLFAESCHSSCKRMSKTNAKLISGKNDFGKGKESKKYRRKNKGHCPAW